MAKFLFTNAASSLLATTIDDNDLTLQVGASDGDLFPLPSAGDMFALTLVNASGDQEIVYCTSRTGDLLTIVRGQEGTSAQEWIGGQTRVELSLTAGTQEAMLQRGGDTLEGDLDADGNEIQDAVLTGAGTQILEGEIVAVPLRGATGDSSNEIAVPDDGSAATMGGSPLLTQSQLMTSFPSGAVIMWHGSLGAIPSGWALCDGTNGTPDMRDKFVIGAGGSVSVGGTGGSSTTSSTSGNTGSTVLTEAQMPSHTHSVRGAGGPGTVVSRPNISDAGTYGLGGAAYSAGSPNPGYVDTAPGDGAEYIQAAGSGDGHTHTVDAHTHTSTPPYVGLYFIKKT